MFAGNFSQTPTVVKDPLNGGVPFGGNIVPTNRLSPIALALQQYYVKMVHDGLDKKLPFQEAMLLGYKAALCSPHFLYHIEPVEFGKSTKLDNHALANRLSYFLWSSLPDRELSWAASHTVQEAQAVLTRPR